MNSAEDLQQLASESLLAHYAEYCEGAVIVDAEARIVWMNERYPERLGIAVPEQVVGQEIEKIIPNSLMRQVVETGRPIMLDIMEFGDAAFVVTRLPLHDKAGKVVGAVGFMLYDDTRHVLSLMSRYQRLRSDLAEAKKKLAEARKTKYTFASFVGAGAACSAVKQAARRAARTTAAVLILGETGTGKELLAQAIHAASARIDAPFVAVNIAAVPETLLEAEFFGVAPGAYTGAERGGRDGKFKLADGGTLFLDEIGDMSPALQAKLLRTLQEGEFEPVGSNRLTTVDVRVIAATSRNLEKMVADGQFRADLYYRLNVITLRTPPLRERLEDFALLADYLVDSICRNQGMPPRGISAGAINRLCQHDWPGNVRELANVLERALLMSDSDTLEADDLDAVMPATPVDSPKVVSLRPVGMAEAVAQAEREAIRQALQSARGNKAEAARQLGISRAALYEKMAALGVDAQLA
ncbi:sigma 54-interacting transcriptional regulator [Dechloromonas sp. XY25]|uniref:Sigma 54-interacting transcriptional regulator n=1 Tax=Dechloromonas hankyongensis TaxID=2908002 RepID=A0ABS9JZD9_9RHOO|nr:sigma 54-interacting transcriptional regulator [Dechloromonas hankyongensis]MCG2576282.1 sigma 54-interacting transcriptional regulator [Dechloromonas hankyongensis]